MLEKPCTVAAILISVVTGAPSLAQSGGGDGVRLKRQDAQPAAQPAIKSPLSGHVSVLDLPRLSRDDLSSPPSQPSSQASSLNGSAAATGFQGGAMAPQLDADSNRLLRGFTDAQRTAPVLRANLASDPDKAPYVWAQSGEGGYYDQSGHCKERVWGDHLREYGGKFADGTPVPKGQVKVNAMGHIWWQPNLGPGPGYFWAHK